MAIRPIVGLRSASSMSSDVDLPAPLGPRNATVSPGQSSSDRPSTARTLPYTLLTWSNDTTGAGPGCVSPGLIWPLLSLVPTPARAARPAGRFPGGRGSCQEGTGAAISGTSPESGRPGGIFPAAPPRLGP